MPEKAVVVGIDKTKLIPFEFAREKLQKWPAEIHINEHLEIVSQNE